MTYVAPLSFMQLGPVVFPLVNLVLHDEPTGNLLNTEINIRIFLIIHRENTKEMNNVCKSDTDLALIYTNFTFIFSPEVFHISISPRTLSSLEIG